MINRLLCSTRQCCCSISEGFYFSFTFQLSYSISVIEVSSKNKIMLRSSLVCMSSLCLIVCVQWSMRFLFSVKERSVVLIAWCFDISCLLACIVKANYWSSKSHITADSACSSCEFVANLFWSSTGKCWIENIS